MEPSAPFRLDLTVWALRGVSQRGRPLGRVGRIRACAPDQRRSRLLTVTQEGGPIAPRLSVVVGGGAVGPRDGGCAPCAASAAGAGRRPVGVRGDGRCRPDVGPLAERMRGLKPPRFPTVFEALVNGVACQQLSLAVGIHLLNRLTAAHGRATSDDPDGARAFPDPAMLAALEPEELKRHGFSLTKARTIVEAARAIAAGKLDLEALQRLDDAAAVERLTRLRGVGRWTAEYVLLRGLGRLNVFPGETSARRTSSTPPGDRDPARLRSRSSTGGTLAALCRRLLPPAARLAHALRDGARPR